MGLPSLDAIKTLAGGTRRETDEYETRGTVTKVTEGAVYVRFEGSEIDTPIDESCAGVKVGDVVSVHVSHGDTNIIGNRSTPATDDTRANAAYSVASDAATDAARAYQSAEVAAEAAASATSDAATAKASAESAQTDAIAASKAAASAGVSAARAQAALDTMGDYDWDSEEFDPDASLFYKDELGAHIVDARGADGKYRTDINSGGMQVSDIQNGGAVVASFGERVALDGGVTSLEIDGDSVDIKRSDETRLSIGTKVDVAGVAHNEMTGKENLKFSSSDESSDGLRKASVTIHLDPHARSLSAPASWLTLGSAYESKDESGAETINFARLDMRSDEEKSYVSLVADDLLLQGNEDLHIGGKRLIDLAYPVGAIYMSTSSTSPQTLFGGTWKRIANGRVLVGAGTSDETYTAGDTGGESMVNLTALQMPSHHHATMQDDFPRFVTASAGVANSRIATSTSGTRTAPTFSYATDGNTFSSAYAQTGNTGGTQPHENMPPYLVVYMWERTA